MNTLKRLFKFISVITILVAIGFGVYGGYHILKDFLNEKAHDKERINSKTLTEYVKTHSMEYVHNSNLALEFYAKDIKCSELENKEILAFYNNYLILDDYSVYETTFSNGKYYSNDEQCKKIETDIKFKNVKKSSFSYVFISEDNKIYYLSEGQFSLYGTNKILLQDDIKMFVRYIEEDFDKTTAEVIKNDGNLYKQTYRVTYENSDITLSLLDEEIVVSEDTYGKILDIEYSTLINIDIYTEKDLEETTIVRLVTDKSLYIGKYIETEQCKKYEDIPCEVKLVKSDIYEKYKNDIRFMDVNYIFTNDNYIIRTDMLVAELDEEVK